MRGGATDVRRYDHCQSVWLAHCGVVDVGRFRKRVKPLLESGITLGAWERAVVVYAATLRDRGRPMKLEFFLDEWATWHREGEASCLDLWPGYALATGITDPEAYKALHRERLAARDAAVEAAVCPPEPTDTTPTLLPVSQP